MKASDLFVQCLENGGVEYIFGIPGEENTDLIDSLVGSKIEFIVVHHEQAAAFMADVYGRLPREGWCLFGNTRARGDQPAGMRRQKKVPKWNAVEILKEI